MSDKQPTRQQQGQTAQQPELSASADDKAAAEFQTKQAAWVAAQMAETDRLKAETDAKAAKAKAEEEARAKAAKAAQEQAEADMVARRDHAHGAQVVLDPDSDAALAARGGMHPSIHENTQARDADLIDMGLDPHAPSAQLTDKPPAPAPQPAA